MLCQSTPNVSLPTVTGQFLMILKKVAVLGLPPKTLQTVTPGLFPSLFLVPSLHMSLMKADSLLVKADFLFVSPMKPGLPFIVSCMKPGTPPPMKPGPLYFPSPMKAGCSPFAHMMLALLLVLLLLTMTVLLRLCPFVVGLSLHGIPGILDP